LAVAGEVVTTPAGAGLSTGLSTRLATGFGGGTATFDSVESVAAIAADSRSARLVSIAPGLAGTSTLAGFAFGTTAGIGGLRVVDEAGAVVAGMAFDPAAPGGVGFVCDGAPTGPLGFGKRFPGLAVSGAG